MPGSAKTARKRKPDKPKSTTPKPKAKTGVPKPGSALASQLLATLQSERALGGDRYPSTPERLFELVDAEDADEVVAALRSKLLTRDVVLFAKAFNAKTKDLAGKKKDARGAVVCFVADLESVLQTEAVFVNLLERSGKRDLFTAAALAKEAPGSVAKQIKPNLDALRENEQLRRIGFLRADKQVLNYFLIDRVGAQQLAYVRNAVENGSPPSRTESRQRALSTSMREAVPKHADSSDGGTHGFDPASVDPLEEESSDSVVAFVSPVSASTSPSLDDAFVRAFEATFERLDAANGGDNWVSLLDVRRAMPEYGRAEFDAALANLRRDRVFGLESVDGRHRLPSPEEIEAAIHEMGRTLLFVKRRGGR